MEGAGRWRVGPPLRSGRNDDFWMPDEKCSKCLLCEAPFTFLRRRHHCRVCGRIFCGTCSSHVISGLALGNDSPDFVRACDECFKAKNPERAATPPPAIPGGAAQPAPPIDQEPEPEPDGKLFPSGPQRTAAPPAGMPDGGAAEDCEEGEDEYAPPIEAVEVPLPAAAAADSAAREERSRQLTQAAQTRLTAIVAQLLRDEQLGDEWVEHILHMATRAVESVNIDPLDIDFQGFVHVKRIPGGTIADESPRGAPVAEGWGGMGCGFVNGVVARKTVSHNKMPTDLVDPKIMLLGCALEMSSEGEKSRIIPLDTLMEQEESYLKILVRKIKALGPNLVLVQKGAARQVQMQLQEANISVVINVKPEVLKRIARCTGGEVTEQIQQIINPTSTVALGTCDRWCVKLFPQYKGSKSMKRYMIFQGCRARLGCTITLRGSDEETLSKVKKVTKFAVYAAHSMRLEAAFIRDAGGAPGDRRERPPGTECILAVSAAFEHPLPKVVDMGEYYSRFFVRPREEDGARLREDEVRLLWDKNPETISRRQRILVLQHTPMIPKKRGAPPERWTPPPLEVKLIEFYNRQSDVTVRHFLRTTCFDNLFGGASAGHGGKYKKSDRKDPRTYTHKNYRLTIQVLPLPNKPGVLADESDDHYLMWCSCKETGRVTACHKMSQEALSCSFGKLLEAFFHDDTTLCVETGKRLYRDHVIYFSFQSLVAKFDCCEIAVYECSLPRTEQIPDDRQKQMVEWNESVDRVRMAVKWTYSKAMKIIPELVAQEPNEQLKEKLQGMLKAMETESRKLTADLEALPASLDNVETQLLPCLVDLSNLVFFLQEREEAFLVKLQSLFGLANHGRQRSRHAKVLSFEQEAMDAAVQQAMVGMEQQQIGADFQQSDMGEPHPMLLSMLEIAKLGQWLQLEKLAEEYKYDYDRQISELDRDSDAAAELRLDTSVIPPGETLGLLHVLVLEDQVAVLWHLYEKYGIDFEAIRTTHEAVPRTAHDMCSSGGMADLLAHIMKGRPGDNDALIPGFEYAGAGAGGESAAENGIVDSEYFAPPASVLEACRDYEHTAAAAEMESSTDQSQTCAVASVAGGSAADADPGAETVPPVDGSSPPSFSVPVPTVGATAAAVAAEEAAVAAVEEAGTEMILDGEGLPYVSPLVARVQPRVGGTNLLETMIALATADITVPDEVLEFFQGDCGFQSSRLSSESVASSGMAAQKNVIIYKSEPSSLIAHALNSSRYRDFINGFTTLSTNLLRDEDGLTYGGGDRSKIDFTYEVSAKDISGHTATFRCTVVHAPHFHALREKYCEGEGDSCYISSLMHCKDWSDNNGGKAASFFKTHDERYIVKKINKEEWEDFKSIGPKYFDHVARALWERMPSCLVKILGVYKLELTTGSRSSNTLGGRDEGDPYFIVMENLFWGREISQIFDLKGSLRAQRWIDTGLDDLEILEQPPVLGGAGLKVLLDQNFRMLNALQPVLLWEMSKSVLDMSLKSDTTFLTQNDLMDYSLLCGVERGSQQLVVGIIDFIRQYDMKKTVESKAKAMFSIVEEPPTIIPSRDYKKRFLSRMTQYFLPVPTWFTDTASDAA